MLQQVVALRLLKGWHTTILAATHRAGKESEISVCGILRHGFLAFLDLCAVSLVFLSQIVYNNFIMPCYGSLWQMNQFVFTAKKLEYESYCGGEIPRRTNFGQAFWVYTRRRHDILKNKIFSKV